MGQIVNIKNWAQFVNESNGDKIIYHFTESIDSLSSILYGDSLQSGSFNGRYGRGYDNVSFTWNSSLWDIEYGGDEDDRYKVRISFNYTEMEKKWDFVPFDYGIPEEEEEIVETEEMKGIIEYITEILIISKGNKTEIRNLSKRYPNLNIQPYKKMKMYYGS